MSLDLIYRVRPAVPQAHRFQVDIEIPSSGAELVELSLPAWIPGSYMIRDFARNVLTLVAESADGTPLECRKRDKQTWFCRAAGSAIRVRYQVYAWDLSVRAAHLDTTHAYFNGAVLLMRVRGMDDRRCLVDLLPADGRVEGKWEVATSLTPEQIDVRGFGCYRAENYDDLIDHPVEMGRFERVAFDLAGVPHRMAITGRQYADKARLESDLLRICGEHAALFGELPIDRYLFLVTALGEGYGGLEHRFSTSLLCSRNDLPHPNDEKPTDAYVRFLGLCSHEYFHLWHVKRIRPLALMNGGLDREIHTRTLWAFEGITSYYDELALVRSGRIDVRTYLGLLAATITRLARTPGREVQTLAASSFDAWTKFYKQDENAPNAIVSYYVKGALMALALDLTIRDGTQGRVSLDDVMRALWGRYGRTGLGVPEHGVEAIAAEVSGLDLGGFFSTALEGTEELDLEPLLAGVGIAMRLRPSDGPKDQGGCPEHFDHREARPTLDLRLRPGAAEAIVQNVIRDGPGERAGIAPGDVVVAVDGLRATAENLESLVARAAAPSGVRLHLFRRDELIEVLAIPAPARFDTCDLMLLDGVSPQVLEARTRWLASVVRSDGDGDA
ncbi:M61 family metallopeptidase [Thiocapsa bogorovii]|uniref:M61 family metallopeptidase n=1 Tax=Thiocapsa bogorovii TaxID=521689 RepID=UPI001E2AB98E|nr:PDZ domain-containing protein [Thiocapsa bogorovii]UHD18162.1 PDZ domain-containing protein [Thiocapsa bogorovii]